MALTGFSRYRYCTVLDLGDENNTKYLDEREPFRFKDERDNRIHVAVEGDTWWTLAWKYFRFARMPSLLWWLLCEFQPVPVIDPTIKIAKGTQIFIPSERLVRTQVFNRERRRYH